MDLAGLSSWVTGPFVKLREHSVAAALRDASLASLSKPLRDRWSVAALRQAQGALVDCPRFVGIRERSSTLDSAPLAGVKVSSGALGEFSGSGVAEVVEFVVVNAEEMGDFVQHGDAHLFDQLALTAHHSQERALEDEDPVG